MVHACGDLARRRLRSCPPVGRHPDRPARAAQHGRPPRGRRNAREARSGHRPPARSPRSRRPRRTAQSQPARGGRARRDGGRATPRGHPCAPRQGRRRLRLDQGLLDRVAALDVVVRRDRRPSGRATRTALRARGVIAHAEVHQPRHGGVPRPRPHDRGLRTHSEPSAAARPGGRNRAPGVPARRARRAPAVDGVGDAAPHPGRGRHQGARRQGCQPRDGARGRGPARLAARHVRQQAGDGRRLQARARLGAHSRTHRRREDRGRRAQPVRRRLRVAARLAPGGDRSHRLRDAARHGDRPGGGRQAHRRPAPALHTRRRPRRVRRRDLVPHPPARRERQPRELHVGGVRSPTSRRTRCRTAPRPCPTEGRTARGSGSRRQRSRSSGHPSSKPTR